MAKQKRNSHRTTGARPGDQEKEQMKQSAKGQHAAKATHPRGDFEDPAPPEFTNRDHPDAVGSHVSAPGAGVVSTGHVELDTDAPGIPHFDKQVAKRGVPAARKMAPGAATPGTTDSGGPSAVPSFGGEGGDVAGSRATESASEGGTAPLAPPGWESPNESAGEAAVETNDPNYSAASVARTAPRDSGVSRMDTSGRQEEPVATHARNPRLVRDVMTADVEVCNPNTELYYVARMMMERDCGAIPVVESTDSMRPVGIITDRDIVVRSIAKNANPLSQRARDCMSTDLRTISLDAPLQDCVRQMEQAQLRRMLVIDNTGRLCGIVAQADLAESTDEHLSAELLKEVSESAHGQAPPT
jgi:CBS domain-containing protein